MKKLLLLFIRGYQIALSPFFGMHCRFHPTCSEYAREAIELHGVLKGAGLAIWRLLRCNPWCEGGIDEVPPKKQ